MTDTDRVDDNELLSLMSGYPLADRKMVAASLLARGEIDAKVYARMCAVGAGDDDE